MKRYWIMFKAIVRYVNSVIGIAQAHKESLDRGDGGLWNEDFQQIVDEDVIDDLFTCVACDYLGVEYPTR